MYFYLQVKINGQNTEMLKAAAEQFGAKTEEEISESKYSFVSCKMASFFDE